jgi:GNAT superfamily N-acetyltransferase
LNKAFKIRVFSDKDKDKVINLISAIRINEYNLNFDLEGLDSDLLKIENYYFKPNGCFWVAEDKNNDIIGTTGLRNLAQFTLTCELNRMYIASKFRRLGIGQELLNTAFNFAIFAGYKIMLLDTYYCYDVARKLYMKNGFYDVPRYNDNPRSQVFMKKKL